MSKLSEEIAKQIEKEVEAAVRIRGTLGALKLCDSETPPEEKERMRKFADEIYYAHFATKEPIMNFGVFAARILSIFSVNVLDTGRIEKEKGEVH